MSIQGSQTARYYAAPAGDGSFDVCMKDSDGFIAVVDTKKTREAAERTANKWRDREAKAIVRSRREKME